MKIYLSDIDELRKRFFARLQREYDAFQSRILRLPREKIYESSLKITFYREVYLYLNDDVLKDEEYADFAGENILGKLWEVFTVSELPRQTRDYLRQLVKLYRDNRARAKGK